MKNFEEHNPQISPPSIKEVEYALNELRSHNRRHTGVTGAFGRLVKLMNHNLPDGEGNKELGENRSSQVDDREQRLNREAEAEAELSEELMSFNALPIFNQAGISFYDAEKSTQIEGSNKSITMPSRQGLFVEDMSLFSEFIERNKNDIYKSEAVSKMLSDIYNSLISDIEKTDGDYRDSMADDLKNIDEILNKVEFGDPKPNFEVGQAYILWSKKEEFPDYLKARTLGLRQGVGFDAHRWHEDSAKETLETNWSKLLNHYESVKNFYGKDNVLASLMKLEIKDALSELRQWTEKEHPQIDEEYVSNIKNALKKIEIRTKELRL